MTANFELIHDISSRGAELDIGSAWVGSTIAIDSNYVSGPDGRLEAQIIKHISAAEILLGQTIQLPGDLTLAGLTVELGLWVKEDPEFPGYTGEILIFDPGNTQIGNLAWEAFGSYTLQRLLHTFSSNLSDTSFIVRLDGNDGASGDQFIASRMHVSIGSGNVEILPEFDYRQSDRKIENVHRTRGGGRFVYKWGEYFQAKFSMRFVNSMDHAIVNSWWNENTQLLWLVDTGAIVESVQIVNRQLPIGEFIMPHNDLYQGGIELETY